MARKIRWSIPAQKDRKSIFQYWNEHNISNVYSNKLEGLFKEEAKLIAAYPFCGKSTKIPEV